MKSKLLNVIVILIGMFVISGCTIFSKKTSYPEGLNEVIKQKIPTSNDFVARVIRYNEDITSSRPGQKIVSELNILAPMFQRKNIHNIEVQIDLYKDTKGDCPQCLAAFAIIPEIATRNIEVKWITTDKLGVSTVLNSAKLEYTTYTQIFLLPVGIYYLVGRVLSGNWDSILGFKENFNYSGMRIDAAAELNSIMIQEIIKNNYEIPKNKNSNN